MFCISVFLNAVSKRMFLLLAVLAGSRSAPAQGGPLQARQTPSTFDKRPHLIQDFTRDRSVLQASMNQVGIPLLRESNLFDALYDTIDRLQGLDGRKYVILLTGGADSFSARPWMTSMKRSGRQRTLVIYSIETDRDSEHRQETNQMRSFARMSGGEFFFARSPLEFEDVRTEHSPALPAHVSSNTYSIGWRLATKSRLK